MQESAFQYVVCKMAIIWSRPQCVKTGMKYVDLVLFHNMNNALLPADYQIYLSHYNQDVKINVI